MNGIWKLNLTPNWSFFAWIIVWNILLTRKKLRDIGLNFSRECLFCHNEDENVNHLFKLCSFTATIWATINLNWPNPSNSNFYIIGLSTSGLIGIGITKCLLTLYRKLLQYFGPFGTTWIILFSRITNITLLILLIGLSICTIIRFFILKETLTWMY